MSAELLRQTAQLLRERAEKATPGPWRARELRSRTVASAHWLIEGAILEEDRPNGRYLKAATEVATLPIWDGLEDDVRADANHIAAIGNPAVALALADILGYAADSWDKSRANGHDDAAISEADGMPEALALARVYFGEVP